MRADSGSVFAQRGDDIEPHAIDMDMQLVLRRALIELIASPMRIARQRAMRALLDITPRLPGVLPVVRRVRREDLRAFDAADARGRNQQELGIPHDVLQHRVAAGEIDLFARLGRVILLLVRDALLAHDLPQRIGIRGAVTRRYQTEKRGQYKNRHGKYQPDSPPPLAGGGGGGDATTRAHRRVGAHPHHPPSCRSRDP